MSEIKETVVVPSFALSRERRINREALAAKRSSGERQALNLEIATDIEDLKYRPLDAQLAMTIGNEFVRQYPGRGWQVEADIRNGIVKVYNTHISGKFGWIWKTADINLGRIAFDVRKIGGEMLERSKMSRGKFNDEQVAEARATGLIYEGVHQK